MNTQKDWFNKVSGNRSMRSIATSIGTRMCGQLYIGGHRVRYSGRGTCQIAAYRSVRIGAFWRLPSSLFSRGFCGGFAGRGEYAENTCEPMFYNASLCNILRNDRLPAQIGKPPLIAMMNGGDLWSCRELNLW